MTSIVSLEPPASLVIASRESALAMWQARNIREQLEKLYPQTSVTIRGMTHASIPPARRAQLGVTDNLVRLSVGIEDVADLRADLDRALAE